jgi:hypothetical protein
VLGPPPVMRKYRETSMMRKSISVDPPPKKKSYEEKKVLH